MTQHAAHRFFGAPHRTRASLLLVMLVFGCSAPFSLRESAPPLSTNPLGLSRLAPPQRPSAVQLSRDTAPGREQACLPYFPDQDGWSGGDAAYSIPLPSAHQTLWLFGDSFFRQGPSGTGLPSSQSAHSAPRQYPFLHNTIARSTCDPNGNWRIEYFAGRDAQGQPSDFIRPDPAAQWVARATAVHQNEAQGPGLPGSVTTQPYYWLFDAFYAHETLFMGLLRVGTGAPQGEFGFPIRLYGVDLARIENFRDSPDQWRIQLSALTDEDDLIPASAFVVLDQHLYAFAFLNQNDGQSPRTLARLPLHDLAHWEDDLTQGLRFLTEDGQWRARTPDMRPRFLMKDDATEMSVHFDTVNDQWLAVYSRLPRVNTEIDAEINAAKIWARSADRIDGPWSSPQAIFEIPEVAKARRTGDNQVFCYAGKAHPQFSGPERLVLTYVCNLFARDPSDVMNALQNLKKRTDLYRPQAVFFSRPHPAPTAD